MKRGQRQESANLDFITIIHNYMPTLVLQKMINRQERVTMYKKQGNKEQLKKEQDSEQKLPELQPMETVVLFADISGFTTLSEACANMGVRGNEELANAINSYMEGMCRHLGKFGGDIIKFVGDAIIVMWPPPTKYGPGFDPKQDTVKKAIQCALDIQREMGQLVVLGGLASLSVKIGIGFGKCALLYVGGIFNRAEFFTVGDALKQALGSEGCASGGGETIVSENAFDCVRDQYVSKELKDKNGKKFYLVSRPVSEAYQVRGNSQLLRNKFDAEIFQNIQQKLRFWVPAAIIPYLQIGAESYGSETRSLTVMFLNLGIDLSSSETIEGREKIQQIFSTVQKCIYRLRGSVNKLVMDDKGSTFICLWGVCPLSHEDDAARAILTGFNITRELYKIDKTTCKIGISSGEAFSGLVGSKGSRKEFSVLGDVVNLAARIMGSLKYSKQIMAVDLNTRNLASNYFHFSYCGHKEFKGKQICSPIFEPIDPNQVSFNAIVKGKFYSPEAMLYTHSNPLILDRSMDLKKKNKPIGIDNLLSDLEGSLIKFCKDDDYTNQPFLACIKGEVGSGKTLFALNFIDRLTSSKEFRFIQDKVGEMPLYTSSLNAESELQFLNIWRPILQMMLMHICKRDGKKKFQVLRMLISAGDNESKHEGKLDLLCEILGLEREQIESKIPKKYLDAPQITPKQTPFPFCTRPDYDKRADIIELLLDFFKMGIGETEDMSLIDVSKVEKSHTRVQRSEGSSDESDHKPGETPVTIIILDNAHLMDQASWQLFEAIRDACYKVAIIMCMRTDDVGQLCIAADVKPIFDSIWFTPAMEDLLQIDMPELDEIQLKALIEECAGKYMASYLDEVTKMTEIKDPSTSIITEQMQQQWNQRLTQKWQLSNAIKSVDLEVLKMIVHKCSGNPLICLNLFLNMLHNGFLYVGAAGMVVPTLEYIKCRNLKDWNSVPVPRVAMKMICSKFDDIIRIHKDNPKKRPGEFELCMTSIVVLKSAVVLGDEFELRALKNVQPLSRIRSDKMLLNCLKFLEMHEMIEILDETDNRNVLCRFIKNFLRESLYQTLLHRNCKQKLHESAASYLMTSPLSLQQDPEVEAEKLTTHLLKASDVKNESQLSYQSKTGLIVRRIQNLIISAPNALVIEQMIYKEARATGKNQMRYCTLTGKHIRWYHNVNELRAGTFIGSVPLVNIMSCKATKSKEQSKFAFTVATTLCFDKKNKEDKPKAQKAIQNLVFCCDDQNSRDRWVISIDFLKARASYEDYTSRNIPVQFPLQSISKEDIEDESNNMGDLLFDFANKLKNKTTMAGIGKQNTSMMSGILPGRSFISKNDKGQRFSIMQQMEERAPVFTAAELKPKLMLLYNSGIVSFVNHVMQSSCKMSVMQQQQRLGQLPERAIKEMAQTTMELLVSVSDAGSASNRSSIVNPEPIVKFQKQINDLGGLNEKPKPRRVSVSSAVDIRRGTAKFNINHIAEESSFNSSNASSKNYQANKTQSKTKLDLDKRRSQEVIDPNLTQMLKKSEEENISTQIKKVAGKTPSPDSTNQIEMKPIIPAGSIDFSAEQDQVLSLVAKERTHYQRKEAEAVNTFAPKQFSPTNNKVWASYGENAEKPGSLIDSVEASSIHPNPANEYNEFPNDFSNISVNTANSKLHRAITANFKRQDQTASQSKKSSPPQELTLDLKAQHKKPKSPTSPSPETTTKFGDLTNATELKIINSIERMIHSQIDQGFKEIIIKNQQMIETQQKQIDQQMQLLNQSLQQNKMLIEQQSLVVNRQPSNPRGKGITSKSKRQLNQSMAETPHKTTSDDDLEPEDPDSILRVDNNAHLNGHRRGNSSLNDSEIRQLYQDYPPMLKQLGTSPKYTPPTHSHPQQNNRQDQALLHLRQEQKPPLQCQEPKQSELGASTAKYMQRLLKKQMLMTQQVAKQAQQHELPQTKFFPLPDHLWDEQLAKQPQDDSKYAKSLRKVQCQLIGDMMIIPANTKVRIVERIPQIQMYRVKYNKRVGLFFMKDFAPITDHPTILIPRAQQQSALHQDEPDSAQTKDNSQVTTKIDPSLLGQVAQKFDQASNQSLGSVNLSNQQVVEKVKRNNFFKEKGKFDFLY